MTSVHMNPMREEVYVRQPQEQTNTYGTNIQPMATGMQQQQSLQQGGLGGLPYDRASLESAEMAAFEKGRMQGEMEAIRRAEAAAPLKTMAPTGAELAAQQAALAQPDVVEINRMTWLQRVSWVLGELCTVAFVVMTIVWLEEYRGGFDWDDSSRSGNIGFFNVGILTFALGLMFNAQAVSNYRALPINTNAWFNRGWYIFMQCAAIVCYSIALAAIIIPVPTTRVGASESRFWRVDNWCFVLALAIYLPHAFYSMARAVMERVWPVKYEDWAEVNNRIDTHHHRGLKERAAPGHVDLRTLYAPAPHSVIRGKNLPAANANVGAQVPVAPANAPRWAENPRTHAEDYFLLARAKWANVAYWAMGAAFLMLLAAQQQILAAGRLNWAQDGSLVTPLGQSSRNAKLLSATGLLALLSLIFISYASMPPRTTLVKNGILTGADARRPSISHNADTNIGGHHNRDHNIV